MREAEIALEVEETVDVDVSSTCLSSTVEKHLAYCKSTAKLRNFLVMNGLKHATPRIIGRELMPLELHNEIALDKLYAKARSMKRQRIKAKCRLEDNVKLMPHFSNILVSPPPEPVKMLNPLLNSKRRITKSPVGNIGGKK